MPDGLIGALVSRTEDQIGASADQSKANPLPAGSFFVMSPGMQHYVYAVTRPTEPTFINPRRGSQGSGSARLGLSQKGGLPCLPRENR